VTVAGYCHRIGIGISLLNKYLVTYTPPRRIEVYTVLSGEVLNCLVLGEVFGRLVLNIMVQCKDGLFRVVDSLRADGFKSVR